MSSISIDMDPYLASGIDVRISMGGIIVAHATSRTALRHIQILTRRPRTGDDAVLGVHESERAVGGEAVEEDCEPSTEVS